MRRGSTGRTTVGFREGLKRTARMQREGGLALSKFMDMFDLQLAVLQRQQPSPGLQGLINKIKESITKAEGYLRGDKPYGVAPAQWMSLQAMVPAAEEVVERYESVIEQMLEAQESEQRLLELEREAGLAPANGAPVTNGAPANGAPPNGEQLPPDQQIDSPIPENGGFPTGAVVVGGLLLVGVGVGVWALFFREKE